MQGVYRQVQSGRYGYDWAFEPNDEPNTLPRYHERNLALDWCEEQFGPNMKEDKNSGWSPLYGTFVFVNRADAMLFKLTWC